MMNIFSISLKLIRHRKQRKFITSLIIGLGSFLLFTGVAAYDQISWKLNQSIFGINLVVGPKGDPDRLIWSTMLFLDKPEGSISVTEFNNTIKPYANLIDQSIPVIIVDNYKGFQVVATSIGYLNNFGTRDLETSRFPDKTTEAIIGYKVAAKTGLKIGQKFSLSGGDSAEKQEYTVVGTIDRMNSIIDSLILTDTESYERSHTRTGERMVTAVFVKYMFADAAKILPDAINKSSSMIAVSPREVVDDFLETLKKVRNAIIYFGLAVLALGIFSLYVSLNNYYRDRVSDFILMRSLGASGSRLAAMIIIQGCFISGIGILTGIICGHLAVELISIIFLKYFQSPIPLSYFIGLEVKTFFEIAAAGIAVSLPVALKAYHTSIR